MAREDLTNASTEVERLLQFFYLVPVGLVQTDRVGTIQRMNPLATQLMMQVSGGGHCTNLFDTLDPIFPDLREIVAEHPEPGVVVDHHDLRARPEAEQVYSLSVHSIDEDQLAFVVHDISEMVRQQRRLLRTEVQLRSLVETVEHHMIVPLDAEGRVSEFNRSIERLTGFGGECVGQSFTFFMADDVDAERCMAAARRSGWAELSVRMAHREADRHWWGESVLSRIPDETGETVGFSLVTRENTEGRRYQEQLEHWASLDTMTGLYNRRVFEAHVEEELQRCARYDLPLAMLMLDIDHFKAVNDKYGHDVGDEVLAELAKRLLSAVRGPDRCGRLGGEEFSVLMTHADREAASQAAQRILLAIRQTPFETSAGPLRITVSIGLALRDEHTRSFAAIYRRADRALYTAKDAGRDQVVEDEDGGDDVMGLSARS